jgi:hypothetical protein
MICVTARQHERKIKMKDAKKDGGFKGDAVKEIKKVPKPKGGDADVAKTNR